ncbi:hypothetical protein niasHT_005056 [Heterodera trifolii]|uniref:Ig-like domain-containing protein n=1 Tax=Heterodera trifolii TaxID=157864 RepID=A0ABD2M6I0_9BILA
MNDTNGVPLELEGRHFHLLDDGQQLLIERVDHRFVGRFSCVAQNLQGRAEKDIVVSLLKAPEMSESELTVEMAERDTQMLECPLRMATDAPADATTLFHWDKNGVPITQQQQHNDGNIQLSPTAQRLHLVRVRPSDAGVFTCVAVNAAGMANATFSVVVLVPPSIADHYGTLEVLTGQTVQLECQPNGIPMPEIKWTHNGQTVEATEGGRIQLLNNSTQLRIERVQRSSDAGRYSCVATNKIGTTEMDTFVEVIEAPQIVDLATELKVIEGGEQRLECKVLGTPTPKVQWQKGGSELLANRGFHFAFTPPNSHNLHIYNTRKEHGGRYTCKASNKGGEARQNIQLTVMVPPTITEGERFIRVAEGANLTLECPANGVPTPQITWHKTDEEGRSKEEERMKKTNTTEKGPPAGGGKMSLRELRETDAGRYTCNATNEAGSANADFFVEVSSKVPLLFLGPHSLLFLVQMHPRIVPLPSNYEVKVVEGDTARMECLPEGKPTPKVKWLKAGRPLSDKSNVILSPKGDALMVLQTRRTDAGSYTCLVENIVGTIEGIFSVSVLIGPHINDTFDQNPHALVGQDVLLPCPVQGIPFPTVQWLKDDRPIADAKTKFVGDGPTDIRLEGVGTADSGRYTCRANNEVGQLDTHFELEVIAPPQLMKEAQRNFEALEGQAVTLLCPIESPPRAGIVWLRATEQIDGPNARISADSKLLTLSRVSLSDGGKYSCRATNLAGHSEADLNLRILIPPRIDKSNMVNNPLALLGKEISMECPAFGIPEPTITWRKGESILLDEGQHRIVLEQRNQTLGIQRVTLSDRGTFSCEVANKVGKVREEFHLEVLVPPEMENGTTERVSRREGEPFELICPLKKGAPGEGADLRVAWTKDGRPLEPETDPHIEIRGEGSLALRSPSLADAGQYKCIASNRAGHSFHKFDVDIFCTDSEFCRHLEHSHKNKLRRKAQQSRERAERFSLGRGGGGDDEEWAEEPFRRHTKLRKQFRHSRGPSRARESFSRPIYAEYAFSMRRLLQGVRGGSAFTGRKLGLPRKRQWLYDSLTLDRATVAHPSASAKVVHAYAPAFMTGGHKPRVNVVRARFQQIRRNWKGLGQGRPQHFGRAETEPHAQLKSDTTVRPNQRTYPKPQIDLSRNAPEPHVIAGRPITLWCSASGNPLPSVRWFLNGLDISQYFSADKGHRHRFLDQGHGLEINPSAPEDVGLWTCQAENRAGTSTADISLDVWVEPTVHVRVEDSTPVKRIGEQMTLLCEAKGNPEPVISWSFREQTLLPSAGKLHISKGAQRLEIARLRVENTGDYYCIAQNEVGSASDFVSIDILMAPAISRESAELNPRLPLGRSLTFFCDVIGKPPPIIRWTKNEKSLKEDANVQLGEGNRSLLIQNISLSDRGVYRCEATNRVGNDSVEYRLDVFQAPIIAKGGTEQAVEGKVAVLDCVASGEPAPLISWQRNGVLVEMGVRYVLEGSRLKVIDTRSSDSGIYVCEATNEAGTDQQAFTLEVLIPPKLTSESARQMAVPRGGNGTLSCTARGYPTPQVIWSVESTNSSHFHPIGTVLKRNAQYELSEDGQTLHLFGLSHEGTRLFRCSAVNNAGIDQLEFEIGIIRAPTLSRKGILTINVTEGEPLLIPCGVIGTGKQIGEQIQWTHNGRPLAGEGPTKSIGQVTRAQGGNYTCTAKNKAGNASSTVMVHVGVAPKIREDEARARGRVIVEKGATAELWCEAVGIPPPKIIWLRDDQPLTKFAPTAFTANEGTGGSVQSADTRRSTAVFGEVQPQHAGVYTCEAENWAGKANKTVDLVVLIPPSISPEREQIEVERGQMVVLQCNATGIPEPLVSWEKADDAAAAHIAGDGGRKYQLLGTSLAIREVEKKDEGIYQCIAKSDAGQTIGVRQIIVKTPQQKKAKRQRIFVECDANGKPVKHSFARVRGDRPKGSDDYGHWTGMPKNGTEVKCLPKGDKFWKKRRWRGRISLERGGKWRVIN